MSGLVLLVGLVLGGALLLGTAGQLGADAVAKMRATLLHSSTAQSLGIVLAPTDADTNKRIDTAAAVAVVVLALMRQRYPHAAVTSGYRTLELTQALIAAGFAADPKSRHMTGLSFDIDVADDEVIPAAQWLRASLSSLPDELRPAQVIAEVYRSHVHIDVFDPLGKIPPSAGTATAWVKRNAPGAAPEYVALAATTEAVA